MIKKQAILTFAPRNKKALWFMQKKKVFTWPKSIFWCCWSRVSKAKSRGSFFIELNIFIGRVVFYSKISLEILFLDWITFIIFRFLVRFGIGNGSSSRIDAEWGLLNWIYKAKI